MAPSASSPLPPESQPFADMQQHLETYVNKIIQSRLHNRKRKQGDDDDDHNVEVTKQYYDYGCAFARLGQPFTNIFTIVEHGLLLASRELESEDEEHVQAPESRTARCLTKSWSILCSIIPGFKEDMIALASKRKFCKVICDEIMAGVNHARTDDTGGLKSAILGYLQLDVTTPIHPPIPAHDIHKSLRGWNHPMTATLLTPMEWEANPSTWADILAGCRRVTADQLPHFLYPEGHVYQPNNIENDLCHGHVIVRNAKHMFMGPSSALQGPGYKKGRPGNAKIIGMTSITAPALAYVVAQSRFALSDAQDWHVIDRDFDYQVFFWNLMEMLETEDGKDILDFYNHEIFGAIEATVPPDVQPLEASGFAQLGEQRAAKRAHRSAEALEV